MNRVDRIEFGKFIRQVRKSKDLRQSDLVDSFLSQTVLSNIESGKGQVSEDKMKYVLKKLGLKENISEFYIHEKEKEQKNQENSLMEELKLKLISIENIIDLANCEEGLDHLREFPIPQKHAYHAIIEYLKGKCYFKKKNWKKSYNHFFNAIHLIDRQFPEMKYTNLKSACYQDLSTIEYVQNNFNQALRYTEEAEKYFIENGERKYCKHLILISKVIYLEKLNRLGDAQAILDELSINNHSSSTTNLYISESKESALNMYEMQAKLLFKSKRFPQAINYALKGIELARIDKMYERSLELWTTLGSIYIEMGKLSMAECCFTTALKLKKKITKEYLLAYVYSQLGKLYYKQGDIKLSEKEFLESLKYSRKTNDVFLEIQALMGLGKCNISINKHDKALDYLNEALKLAKQHAFTDQKNELLLITASFLREIGDPTFKNYALDFFYSYAETFNKGGEVLMLNEFEINKRRSAGDPPNT